MQVTFDPHNDQDCATVARLLGTTASEPQVEPAPAQVESAPAQVESGVVWDPEIHSTPASKNADGSWRARRGKKAIDVPTPNPASAAPATPPAPIDYKTMATRFVAKMGDPDGLPAGYAEIYSALSISYDDLETNQTDIARLSAYMDAVDNGEAHDGCVRHALAL